MHYDILLYDYKKFIEELAKSNELSQIYDKKFFSEKSLIFVEKFEEAQALYFKENLLYLFGKWNKCWNQQVSLTQHHFPTGYPIQ